MGRCVVPATARIWGEMGRDGERWGEMGSCVVPATARRAALRPTETHSCATVCLGAALPPACEPEPSPSVSGLPSVAGARAVCGRAGGRSSTLRGYHLVISGHLGSSRAISGHLGPSRVRLRGTLGGEDDAVEGVVHLLFFKESSTCFAARSHLGRSRSHSGALGSARLAPRVLSVTLGHSRSLSVTLSHSRVL